jgi:hypothetical protein
MSSDTYNKKDRNEYFQKYYREHKEQIISRSIAWSRRFKELNSELYRLKECHYL